jgi:chemotaxis protein CheC
MEEIELSALENDALKEIANVGAGHAAGGLSIIINKKVNLMISDVSINPIKKDSQSVPSFDQKTVVIYAPVISDDVGGNLIMTLPWDSYALILQAMKEGSIAATIAVIDKFQKEIKEIGQTVFYSYAMALNQFLDFNIQFKEPSYVLSSDQEFITEIYKKIDSPADYALVIKTGFSVDASDIQGEFEMSFAPNEITSVLQKIRSQFGF